MKTQKQDLKLSLLYFADACKNAGQGGLIPCGIAEGIRETQTDDVIFWTMVNLVYNLQITDFERLKTFSDLCSKKLSEQLDSFVNCETDYKKASILSGIDFKSANEKLQEYENI